MRYLSFKVGDRESYGVMKDGGVVDLGRRLGQKYPTLKSLITAGFPDEADEAARAPADHPEAAVEYLPTIPDATHVWCLAINYVEHHDEVQSAGRVQDLPKQPALFMRSIDSLVGHKQDLIHPGISEQFDYEGELGVIIGKAGRNVSESDAFKYVAGYTIVNDGSVRDWQFHTRQITPGKNWYHSGSAGPWMVRREDIADPHDLHIKTKLNGLVLQDGTTKDMVHNINKFIAYLSTITVLQPGDILATGTPSGVGFSRKPPVWMKVGDTCTIEVQGVGILSNRVVSAEAASQRSRSRI
jgi:2-keto-4-pentenoate hydratase/2-oxohepta-3-ene-1,7-dioic acid hydratase in catechol pathway